MDEFITPLGREKIKEIIANYPSLWEFYQPHIGNFIIDLEKYEDVFDEVNKWLANHKEYKLELITDNDYEVPFYALYDVNDF